MRVPTTLAAMPLLLTLPLQSRCSPPPMAGVISLYGSPCQAKATNLIVTEISEQDTGKALWLVLNTCDATQDVTVGKFVRKGGVKAYDLVANCQGTNGNPYVSVPAGGAALLKCGIRAGCARPESFVQYSYGVCANGKFLYDPDLRVKGGGKVGPTKGCSEFSDSLVETLCAAKMPTQNPSPEPPATP